MAKYKRVDTANGRTMYFINGKMVSKSAIPADIITKLEPGVELELSEPQPQPEPETEDESPKSESPEKTCIFCGEPGTRMRFLHMQTVWMCEDDYTTHTTGEVAEQMRAKQLV